MPQAYPASPAYPHDVSMNVLGTPLIECGRDPLTGFRRDGCCASAPDDPGVHVVCAIITEDFLAFTRSRGNDLSSPTPSFPGLRPGDRWCLCAARWAEALEAGAAPPVILAATHVRALDWIDLDDLRHHAAEPGAA